MEPMRLTQGHPAGMDRRVYDFMARVPKYAKDTTGGRGRRGATFAARSPSSPSVGQIKFQPRDQTFPTRGRAACRGNGRLIAATHNLLKLHRPPVGRVRPKRRAAAGFPRVLAHRHQSSPAITGHRARSIFPQPLREEHSTPGIPLGSVPTHAHLREDRLHPKTPRGVGRTRAPPVGALTRTTPFTACAYLSLECLSIS